MSDRTATRSQTQQDRQTARSDRTGTRSETQGDRQDARTDRTDIRQENRTDRTEGRQDVRGDRQQEVTDRQKNRQDTARDISDDYHHGGHYDDDWDDWNHWGGWGYVAAGAAVVAGAYAVGTIISATTYSSLSCSNVIVNGITYSQCGSTWYQPTYSGGDVTYIVINPPAGY
jgi:hypothetical protein